MTLIYETENFIVESREKPFVSRNDGGHVRISVKDTSITDRTKLTAKMAIELMRFSMIVGKSLEKAMNKQGIPVVKVNYHDMGNWAFKKNKSPYLHIHIFGRSKNATKQIFPEAIYLPDRGTGFYDNFEPLTDDDIALIKELIEESFASQMFSDSEWGLD